MVILRRSWNPSNAPVSMAAKLGAPDIRISATCLGTPLRKTWFSVAIVICARLTRDNLVSEVRSRSVMMLSDMSSVTRLDSDLGPVFPQSPHLTSVNSAPTT